MHTPIALFIVALLLSIGTPAASACAAAYEPDNDDLESLGLDGVFLWDEEGPKRIDEVIRITTHEVWPGEPDKTGHTYLGSRTGFWSRGNAPDPMAMAHRNGPARLDEEVGLGECSTVNIWMAVRANEHVYRVTFDDGVRWDARDTDGELERRLDEAFGAMQPLDAPVPELRLPSGQGGRQWPWIVIALGAAATVTTLIALDRRSPTT